MPQAVQSRPKVPVREELNSKLILDIPVDLMPKGFPRGITLFFGDDVEQVLPLKEHQELHTLCTGLMPSNERVCQVDHIRIQRFKRKTRMEVQLNTKLTSKCRGRVDAALRASGFDPSVI